MTNELQVDLRLNGYVGEFELSQLIQSFGRVFYSLEQIGPHKWRAQSFATNAERNDDHTRLIGGRVHGKSPEEALALLWLALYGNPGTIA